MPTFEESLKKLWRDRRDTRGGYDLALEDLLMPFDEWRGFVSGPCMNGRSCLQGADIDQVARRLAGKGSRVS